MRLCASARLSLQISFRNGLALGVAAVLALPSLLAIVAVVGFIALEVLLTVA
jgi:maltodextrin utilization protein YvdJ